METPPAPNGMRAKSKAVIGSGNELYHMGKYLTSLLVLASSLFLFDDIYADEAIQKVQEELRKRHLFYADTNGEHGPALTVAIKRYQEKKGFAPTGAIDSEILASLGIAKRAAPLAARTPVVVGNRGDIRGANGEKLPSDPPFLWPKDERITQFDPAIIGRNHIELGLTNHNQPQQRPRPTGKRTSVINGEDETAPPFDIAVELAQERMVHLPGKRLGLPPPSDMYWDLGPMDEERVETEVRSTRQSRRHTRAVRPHKETNPIILTYQTVDRAIQLLFGEARTKRKRVTAKRL